MKKRFLVTLILSFSFGAQVVAGQTEHASSATDLEQRIAAAVLDAKRGNREAFRKVYYEMKRPEAIEYLRKYANDPDSGVRWQIVILVRGQHTPAAIQLLADLVRNKQGLFLPEAVFSLEQYYDCKERHQLRQRV
jgi:HEAT repeat protein